MLIWPLVLALGAAEDGGLLERVRARMADNLSRLPNYTCVETVERIRAEQPCSGCTTRDRLRLEVAVVEGRERLGLPGSERFGDTDPEYLVPGGIVAWGDYAGFVRGIFLHRKGEILYQGRESRDGRSLARYNFRIGASDFGFQLRLRSRSIWTGGSGSFWIDAASLDLVHLEVNMTGIPGDFDLRRVSSMTEYERLPGSRSSFLVPSRTEWKSQERGHGLTTARVEFSGCREYLGETTLRFEEGVDAGSAAPAPRPAVPVKLPPGAVLVTQLAESIDLGAAAAGDRIAAVLKEPVKDGERVLATAGSILRGRIVLLEDLDPQRARDHSYTLGLRFTELEAGGTTMPFHGRVIEMRHFTVDGRMATRPQVESHDETVLIRFGGRAVSVYKGLELRWVKGLE